MSDATHSPRWHLLGFTFSACFIAISFGATFAPGEWYESLNRAPWSPPNIAFPIVWTILYICIAIAGWLIFKSEHSSLKWLWCWQLFFNAIWSWIFFGQHWVLIGFIDIVLLAILIASLILMCWQKQLRVAMFLLLPYLLWVLLASTLNGYILLNNA